MAEHQNLCVFRSCAADQQLQEAMTCRKIRYSSRIATTDDHPPAMPQLTAVDDQFGTHTPRREEISDRDAG
jgi:hypothetical protein